MIWTIEFDERAERDLAKLDKAIQRRIVQYLQKRISPSEDPTAFGHGLTHNLSDLWRFRVGDYRILCRIEKDGLTVLVVAIGHRSSIYDR
ncbi:MAG TPA: type II toxin-antitoxin system RelE/ParE family toxin [Bryobacteraceae bacterium]